MICAAPYDYRGQLSGNDMTTTGPFLNMWKVYKFNLLPPIIQICRLCEIERIPGRLFSSKNAILSDCSG